MLSLFVFGIEISTRDSPHKQLEQLNDFGLKTCSDFEGRRSSVMFAFEGISRRHLSKASLEGISRRHLLKASLDENLFLIGTSKSEAVAHLPCSKLRISKIAQNFPESDQTWRFI